MPNTHFPLFHSEFPPSEERVSYNASQHDAIAAKVPPALADEWRNFGFGAYGAGLLWIPVPDEPFLDPTDWPALDGTGIEVLRTAFADVCIWQGEQLVWQNVHSGNTTPFLPDIELLFDTTVTRKPFRKGVLFEALFKKARKRFGDLKSNECYGFAPFPALGGAMKEENIIKAEMREYVAMAAQIHS